MAITGGSVLRLTLVQNYMAQEVLNVFYAKQTAGSSSDSPATVVDGFWQDIKAAWRAVMPDTDDMLITKIVLEDLVTPFDYYEYVVPTSEQRGTRSYTGALLNSFSAASIKIVVPTRATRPGGKRISGLTEDVVDRQNLVSSYITLLNTLFAALATGWAATSPGSGSYAVGVYGYGRPASSSPTFQQMSGYLVSPYVSSQVSRKIGRGA